MTRLDLAPDLVEEAVFHVARRAAERGDPRAIAWFERRERLYELGEPREREQAFRTHALAHFRALHLEEPLLLALCANNRISPESFMRVWAKLNPAG